MKGLCQDFLRTQPCLRRIVNRIFCPSCPGLPRHGLRSMKLLGLSNSEAAGGKSQRRPLEAIGDTVRVRALAILFHG